MKIYPYGNSKKFHFERPFMYARPPLKVGSFRITINEKIEIVWVRSPCIQGKLDFQVNSFAATTFKCMSCIAVQQHRIFINVAINLEILVRSEKTTVRLIPFKQK